MCTRVCVCVSFKINGKYERNHSFYSRQVTLVVLVIIEAFIDLSFHDKEKNVKKKKKRKEIL